jgi:cytoskeletal protein RodZ
MNPIFGKQLQRAREIRGISLEEAAHATRMRPAMLQALEEGNLEAFPNPAYAKSFLLLYGKYLRLDVKAVAAEIDTAMQVTVDDYQYLTHANETTAGPARRGDFARPHSLPSWGPVLALGGITAIVVFGFLLWLNMSRIGNVAETAPPKPVDEKEAIEPVVAGAQPVKIAVPLAAKKSAPVPVATPAPAPLIASATPDSMPAPLPTQPAATENPPALAANGNQAPLPVYPKDPPPPIVVKAPLPNLAPAPVTIPPKQQIIGAASQPPPIGEPVTQIDGLEVRPARVISPVAKMASNDAALLAAVDNSAPQTPPPLTDLSPVSEPDEPEVEQSALAKDPNTVEIEPIKKTWIVIRGAVGASPIYEDFLYPSARPMRLPGGKYYIEVRDADAVEIRRGGKSIAYTTGGVRIE